MTKYGRVQNDTLVEVIDFDPTGKFHPSVTWEEIPDEAQPGMERDENGWVSPADTPIYLTGETVLLDMITRIEQLHASITGPVPQDIKHGWKAKADWARKWNADNTMSVPQNIIDEINAAEEIYPDLQTLVDKIITNADKYESILAVTQGLLSKMKNELKRVETNTNPFKFDQIFNNFEEQIHIISNDFGVK